jgi:hypothetical protein
MTLYGRSRRKYERLLPEQAMSDNGILRRRRGILDFGGHVFKFLFGTATTSEVQELHSRVSKLDSKKDDMIHAVEAQMTLLRTVDKEARQNTVDLLLEAKSLRGTVSQIIKLNRTLKETADQIQTTFEIQRNVARIMRELEFYALRLQQKLIPLHEGIDVSSSGRLSSVLVPPHNLSVILQQVVLKLLRDISLITGMEVNNMHAYYDVARVPAYSTTGSIRLVVRIPLRGSDRVMILYRAESLPTYSVLKRPIQI